ELPLHLHGESIDGVFNLRRRVGVEMSKAAAEIRRASHLPEQPGQTFGSLRRLLRHESTELLGKVEQDRAGFEHADRLLSAAIHERGNLRVRVHGDEAAAELFTLAD